MGLVAGAAADYRLRQDFVDRLTNPLRGAPLVEFALRLRRASLRDPRLSQRAADQVRNKKVRERIERSLNRIDPALVRELEMLLGEAHPKRARWRLGARNEG